MSTLSRLLFLSLFPLSLLGAPEFLPDRWAPVSKDAALALVEKDSLTWTKTKEQKEILLGLGAHGRDRLARRLAATDPMSVKLRGQMLAAADKAILTPLPRYEANGETAFVAGSEEWMRPWGDELVLFTVVTAIDSKPEYRARLHDLMLTLCRFPSWGKTFLNADLAAGHISRGVAMAWSWHREVWNESEQTEIVRTVGERLPYMCAAIYGGKVWWAGAYTANHNHVSVTGAAWCGAAFLDDIPAAREWLAAAWLNYEQVFQRSHGDGSTPEGVAYWTYGMSFIIQFLEGCRDLLPIEGFYQSAFMRQAGHFRAESSTPGFHGIVPWGDSGPRDFYGPHHFLFRLAAEFKDPEVQSIAAKLPFAPRGNLDVMAWTWLWYEPGLPEALPKNLDRHFETIDVVTSRSGWGERDYLFTLKSGFNNRDHSHLDAGAIALVQGNDWLLPTPGYGTGRVNKNFWDKLGGRWNYFSNSTEAHSTLLLNGRNQRHAYDARAVVTAFASYDPVLWVECDLTQAYEDVSQVKRQVFHRRGEYLIVYDTLQLLKPGRAEWLLQVPPAVTKDSDADLYIQGRVGAVRIHPLEKGVDWLERAPTRPQVDLPATRGKTLSWTKSGEQLAFAVVILPESRANAGKTGWQIESTADGVYTARRDNLRDEIHFAKSPADFTEAGLSGNARFWTFSWEGDLLREIVVQQSTRFVTPEIVIESRDAFSVRMEKNSEKNWSLDFIPATDITVAVSDGWQLEQKVGPDYLPLESRREILAAHGIYRLVQK